MQRKAGLVPILIMVVVAAIGLAGCLIPYVRTAPGPAREVPLYRNGQQLIITGTVIVDGSQITIQDVNGQAVFRLVGLQKAAENSLTHMAGRVTKIRIRVVSAESARVYRAQFIEFVLKQ